MSLWVNKHPFIINSDVIDFNYFYQASTFCDNTIDLPGFHGFHITRDRRPGGVSLYIKNQYDATYVDELSYSSSTIEVCTVDVKVNNFNIIFIAIYRPHSDTVSNFSDELSTLLENIHLRNKFCIIMGDLNICLLKSESPNIDNCKFFVF